MLEWSVPPSEGEDCCQVTTCHVRLLSPLSSLLSWLMFTSDQEDYPDKFSVKSLASQARCEADLSWEVDLISSTIVESNHHRAFIAVSSGCLLWTPLIKYNSQTIRTLCCRYFLLRITKSLSEVVWARRLEHRRLGLLSGEDIWDKICFVTPTPELWD